MTKRNTFAGVLLFALACSVVAVLVGYLLSPTKNGRFPIVLGDRGSGPYVAALRAGGHVPAGIGVGDAIDVSRLNLSQRFRLNYGSPAGTPLTIRIQDAGTWTDRTIVAYNAAPVPLSRILAYVVPGIIGALIFGIIGFRRPSVATAFLVFFSANAIPVPQCILEFTGLPDPFFGVTAIALDTLCGFWPAFALIPFITRFPQPSTTRTGRIRTIAGDLVFLVAGIACLILVMAEPVSDVSWPLFEYVLQAAIFVTSWTFAGLALASLRGDDRRRIAWVIAGFAISEFLVALGNIIGVSSHKATLLLDIFAIGGTVLPPIALTYAVLRHRVIDIGFVINRTLVYGLVTASIVVVVSFVDWLSGKLISESRLALAAEAVVTIAFGVALNAVHSRVEKLVDRFIFRSRYLAERRMHSAIEALAFATSEHAIDAALTTEAAAILGLTCAAIYRRAPSQDAYQRYTAVGWPDDVAASLDDNSLLVRTIRSREQMFFIADLGVAEPSLPSGEGSPVLAAPIATQHTLLGFALYGNERGGGSPDPEIVALLGRLCSAAATAYTNVEARELREQLAAYQRMLGPRAVGAE